MSDAYKPDDQSSIDPLKNCFMNYEDLLNCIPFGNKLDFISMSDDGSDDDSYTLYSIDLDDVGAMFDEDIDLLYQSQWEVLQSRPNIDLSSCTSLKECCLSIWRILLDCRKD